MATKATKREQQLKNQSIPKEFPILAMLVCGSILGLSAPGIELWYLAWIGVVPLILAVSASKNVWSAFLQGLVFGTAYNLTAQQWYLGLQPLDWLGFNAWQGLLLSTTAWLVISVHQGLIVALFAALIRALPMSGTLLPGKTKSSWRAPALTIIPLLWILCLNKVGNAHCLSGVPWSMLEYSQYKQLYFIRCASILGGIGVGFLILFFNVSIASFIATVLKKDQFASLSAPSKEHAFYQLLFACLVLTGASGLGLYSFSRGTASTDLTASILQGNVNIDMQKTAHRYTLYELVARYNRLARNCPPGLCVYTEGAIPAFLRNRENSFKFFPIRHARSDWI